MVNFYVYSFSIAAIPLLLGVLTDLVWEKAVEESKC